MHYQHKAFRAGFNSSFVLHRAAEFWSVNSTRNSLSWWYAATFHLPSFYYSLLQLSSFYYSSVCCYILPWKLEGSWVYSPQSINVVKLLFLPLHISEGKTSSMCTLCYTTDVNTCQEEEKGKKLNCFVKVLFLTKILFKNWTIKTANTWKVDPKEQGVSSGSIFTYTKCLCSQGTSAAAVRDKHLPD